MGAKKKRKEKGPFDALQALKESLSAAQKEAQKKGQQEGQKSLPHKPSPAPPQNRPAAAPEDDAFLFHRLLAGVTPLDRSRGRVPKDRGERSDVPPSSGGRQGLVEIATAREEAERVEADVVHERLRELVEGGARFEVADDGRRVEGRRVDLPIEALRRLRRGMQPIDARLDLHGLRLAEARAELEAFIRTMRARGERCLLVVHGKGDHSPLGMGVLRGEMAAWLSQGPSSQHVGAFVTALERDGGEGAVYVLLRK